MFEILSNITPSEKELIDNMARQIVRQINDMPYLSTIEVTIMLAMFGSIIGCYLLVIRSMNRTSEHLGHLYDALNKHVQDRTVHRDYKEFVSKDHCDPTREALDARLRKLEAALDRIEK